MTAHKTGRTIVNLTTTTTATARAIAAGIAGTYVDAGEHPTERPLAMQAAGVSCEHGVRPDPMALIEEGVAAGHGDEDLSALADLLVTA